MQSSESVSARTVPGPLPQRRGLTVPSRSQELREARSQAEEARRRQAQLENQLESLQQQVRQAQLDRSALEESFSKERALLTSRVETVRSLHGVIFCLPPALRFVVDSLTFDPRYSLLKRYNLQHRV